MKRKKMPILQSGALRLFLAFLLLMASTVLAKDKVLILRSAGAAFEEALNGLTEELGNEFVINEIILQKDAPLEFHLSIQKTSPAVVVLMDNAAINIYKDYVRALSDSSLETPSISLMAIYLDRVIQGLKRGTGIRYEIPAVVSAVNMRAIARKPLKKIGVVYRKFMANLITENKELCRAEDLELIGLELPNEISGKPGALRTALRTLVKKVDVDAIWILNDNALLDIKFIREVWLPELNELKIPSIVGAEVLVNPQLGLGTLAVMPDHYAIGKQAAALLFELLSIKNTGELPPVEHPLSVVKVLNLKQALKRLKVDKSKLGELDRVLD